MAIILAPFIVAAGIGLVLSLIVHVSSLVGLPCPLGEHDAAAREALLTGVVDENRRQSEAGLLRHSSALAERRCPSGHTGGGPASS